MPGPPPAGVSSTVRCLPKPCSRMSRTSSDQSPLASPLPSIETPKGPGNISGKSVRTVADQLLNVVAAFIVFWYRDDHAAAGDVDHRHSLAGEGQEHTVAIGAGNLHHVAGAVIVDGGHLPQHTAFTVLRFQADQVGMIKFLFARRRQLAARDEKLGALERLGGIAVGDAGKRNHRLTVLGGTDGGDLKLLAVLVLEHAVTRKIFGRLSEELDLHRALQPLRADDGGEEDVARHALSRQDAGASSAALAAAGARSCAFFLGWAFCGLLCTRAFTTPALASILWTRSEATAPLAIQALAASRASLMRSA